MTKIFQTSIPSDDELEAQVHTPNDESEARLHRARLGRAAYDEDRTHGPTPGRVTPPPAPANEPTIADPGLDPEADDEAAPEDDQRTPVFDLSAPLTKDDFTKISVRQASYTMLSIDQILDDFKALYGFRPSVEWFLAMSLAEVDPDLVPLDARRPDRRKKNSAAYKPVAVKLSTIMAALQETPARRVKLYR